MFCIYQDPMNSLNSSVKVGKQLYQMAKGYKKMTRTEFDQQMGIILERIKFEDPMRTLNKYPFELSGGMKQRVAIAIALACNPDLIIADEPTTALDVSIQKEIMREFRAINREYQTAILVVTHDFGVVAELADDVIVMHDGHVEEEGTPEEIIEHPKTEYTERLIRSVL